MSFSFTCNLPTHQIDLYEAKNIPQVVINIHSLGRLAQRLGFRGPTLGAKLAEKHEYNFTEEQLIEARNMPTLVSDTTNRNTQANVFGPTIRDQIVRADQAMLSHYRTWYVVMSLELTAPSHCM